VAGLAYAWWPREGTYRPIQPYEGGTLTQAAAAARPAPAGLAQGSYGHVTTAWPKGQSRPTREHPQLALVLVPSKTSATTAQDSSGKQDAPTSWVFPFNKPLAPGKGDNQALAVNTTDNTIQYDVAFALVWVDEDTPALNTNESYAFASCTNCAAVSVAFQVVLVKGDNHVAIPQNLSGALNYNCVNCLTYALATQLFVTLDGPLSPQSMRELDSLWQEIAAFGKNIASVPLSEIRDRLTAYETQILDIVGSDPKSPSPGDARDAAGDGQTPAPGDDPSAQPTDGADGSGGTEGDDTSETGTETGTGTQAGSGTDTAPGADPASPEPGATDPSGAPADPAPTAEPSSGP
jgi:putative peptide zinc metalloprotease protein